MCLLIHSLIPFIRFFHSIYLSFYPILHIKGSQPIDDMWLYFITPFRWLLSFVIHSNRYLYYWIDTFYSIESLNDILGYKTHFTHGYTTLKTSESRVCIESGAKWGKWHAQLCWLHDLSIPNASTWEPSIHHLSSSHLISKLFIDQQNILAISIQSGPKWNIQVFIRVEVKNLLLRLINCSC